MTFDAERYKQTTLAQWEQAADAWHRWGPTLGAWLGPATTRMFDLAAIGAGARVLDVAAGAGEQTLQLARRVGHGGSVLATDISPALLAHAAADARAAGLANVEVRAMDGERLDLPDESFDAVVSRVGLIYFPDQARAVAGMRRVLVPGGRVAAIVYGPAEKNGFFSLPVSIIRRHAKLGPCTPPNAGRVARRRAGRRVGGGRRCVVQLRGRCRLRRSVRVARRHWPSLDPGREIAGEPIRESTNGSPATTIVKPWGT